MADPTINFNTSLSSTPTAAPVQMLDAAPPLPLSIGLVGATAPTTTPAATNSSDDLVGGAVQNLDGTSGMAPYDPGPSAPAVPSLAAASDLPALATPPAAPNQVSLLQNPGYVPTTPGGAYTQDSSLTATTLGVGPSVAAPPLDSQAIAVTPYDSNADAVKLDGSLNPPAGTTQSAPATRPPAPSLTNGGIAILCGRGTTYAVNLSTTISKGYCAIEEWTRYFHQNQELAQAVNPDPFAGFADTQLTTGAASLAAAKIAAAMVPVLFTGVQISQQDVVGRTLCMDNIKILYSFGRNFGDVAITGEILLGNFDDASKAQTTIKSFSDFFWQYRVSNYLLPVTVSLLKETYLVYLEGLSIGAIDPQTHIMPFMMHGTLLDIARDTATQQINSAGLVLTSTDVTQSSIAQALAKTTAVDNTTLTGVTSFSFAVDGTTKTGTVSAINAITGGTPITGMPALPPPAMLPGTIGSIAQLAPSPVATLGNPTASVTGTPPPTPVQPTTVTADGYAAALSSLPPGQLNSVQQRFLTNYNNQVTIPQDNLDANADSMTDAQYQAASASIAAKSASLDAAAVTANSATAAATDQVSATNPFVAAGATLYNVDNTYNPVVVGARVGSSVGTSLDTASANAGNYINTAIISAPGAITGDLQSAGSYVGDAYANATTTTYDTSPGTIQALTNQALLTSQNGGALTPEEQTLVNSASTNNGQAQTNDATVQSAALRIGQTAATPAVFNATQSIMRGP